MNKNLNAEEYSKLLSEAAGGEEMKFATGNFKLSKLIRELQALQQEVGDLPVYMEVKVGNVEKFYPIGGANQMEVSAGTKSNKSAGFSFIQIVPKLM